MRWRWIIGGVVTVALLAWTLRDVSWAEVGRAIARADPAWLVLGVLALLPSFALRARRWGTLLGPSGLKGSFRTRHAAVYLGFAGNCVLPAHAGELARASALHGAAGVPLGVALGSILTERLLDAAVVFLFLLVPCVMGGPAPAAWTLGVLGGALVVAGVALSVAARRADALARWLGRAHPRVGRAAGSVLAGLRVLRHPRRCARAFAESVAVWACSGLFYWAVLQGMGIRAPGFVGALFVQSVAALGIALPSTPGYFGPYEAAVRVGLAPYAVAPDRVVACALTLHFLVFATVIAIGLGCAARLGVPLRAGQVTRS
jgi:uncharacterized membrane protein YbhN (UPF0104 family)